MSTYASLSDIPDQTGRTVIVTGANTGIGRSTAAALAARGARVVIAVRDLAKGERAAAMMSGATEVRPLDLASLDSIRAFAEGFSEPLDLLVNNAGVMIPPLGRTAEGFETQFGVNHLGHFALTNRLLPLIRGRVVTVSSTAHWTGSISFEDPNWERRRYRAWPAYSQSKLANLLFNVELQRRLEAGGSTVRVTAAHPGYAITDLQRHGTDPVTRLVHALGSRTVAQDADGGALPTLHAALADVPSGFFAGPGGPLELRGAPTRARRSRRSRDRELAARLWAMSEELTGVPFGSPKARPEAAASTPA